MARVAGRTGRPYHIVDYSGHPEAERVIVIMGSGGETAKETVAALVAAGERVGVVQIRLFRPFPAEALAAALPATVRRVAVLDRTKEPGSMGEPLFLDTVAALSEAVAEGTGRVDAGGVRRPLRPFLEGVHAGDGAWRVRRAVRRAAAPRLHGRHQRRRFRDEHLLGPDVRHRARRDGPLDLLRTRVGRDGRRQQEHDQDPGRRRRPQRAGVLRLRLEEVGLADGVAPALWSEADPGAVPREPGELHRLPPVRPARPRQRPRPGGAGRDPAPQLPAPAGRGLGLALAAGPGADHRQGDRPLRDRRQPDRP